MSIDHAVRGWDTRVVAVCERNAKVKAAKLLALISGLMIVVVVALVRVTEAGDLPMPDAQSVFPIALEPVARVTALDSFYVFVAMGLVILLVAYFLPTGVALIRHKQNVLSIFLLNLFLGWSFVGWVVAIVWAASVDREAL